MGSTSSAAKESCDSMGNTKATLPLSVGEKRRYRKEVRQPGTQRSLLSLLHKIRRPHTSLSPLTLLHAKSSLDQLWATSVPSGQTTDTAFTKLYLPEQRTLRVDEHQETWQQLHHVCSPCRLSTIRSWGHVHGEDVGSWCPGPWWLRCHLSRPTPFWAYIHSMGGHQCWCVNDFPDSPPWDQESGLQG